MNSTKKLSLSFPEKQLLLPYRVTGGTEAERAVVRGTQVPTFAVAQSTGASEAQRFPAIDTPVQAG